MPDPTLLKKMLASPSADSVRALYPGIETQPGIGYESRGGYSSDDGLFRILGEYVPKADSVYFTPGLDYDPLSTHDRAAIPIYAHELGHVAADRPGDRHLTVLTDEVRNHLRDMPVRHLETVTNIKTNVIDPERRTFRELDKKGLSVTTMLDRMTEEFMSRMLTEAFSIARESGGDSAAAIRRAQELEDTYPGITRVQSLVLARLNQMNPQAAGRNGDNTLVHMSTDEVDALNQLAMSSGIGGLTINPMTGLPEAFKLGDLLKGIGGIGATILGTSVLGPLGGALANTLFTGLTEQNLNKGLRAGLMSYMGGKALQGISDAGNAAVQPSGNTAMGLTQAQIADAGVPMTDGSFFGGLKNAATGGWDTARGALEAGGSAMLSGRDPFVVMPMLGEVNSAIAKEDWEREMLRDQRDYDAAVARAREDYARRFGKNPYGGLYGYCSGGKVRGYADGGTVDLANWNGPEWVRPKVEKLLLERAREKAEGPSGVPELFANPAPEGYIPGFHGEHQWMTPAGAAPQPLTGGQFGSFTNPGVDQILNQGMPGFLADIANYAEGGRVPGGMSDSIPAYVQGTGGVAGMARLSPGEFVVPADVVSMIGDGDSDAGAAELENMMARVRLQKTGSPTQQPPLDPRTLVM